MAVDELKKEISELYLKDFKKELGWMRSVLVLPIQKPIKDIILGKTELPEKFDDIKEFGRRKDVIKFMSLDVCNKLFDFMKEKRLKIEQRKTEEELQGLKNEILGIKVDREDQQKDRNSQVPTAGLQDNIPESDEEHTEGSHRIDPITGGAIASGVGTTVVLTGAKIIDNVDKAKIAESLDATKIRSTIESSISMMEDYKKLMPNSLTEKQVEIVNQHIDHLRRGLADINDDAIDALKALAQEPIGKKMGGIEKEIFQKNGISDKILSKIDKLSDEVVGKSPEEIATLLKANGIEDVHESILKSLSLAENATEVKDMTKILRHGSKLNRIAQTMAGAMRVDVAFLGLDVWMYIETGREAELIKQINKVRGENKQQQANFQLMVGLSSVVIEAAGILALYAATGSAGGPIGAAIGIAVGALTTLVSIGGDSLYYDVRDFYLQDKEDFLRQKRGLLKQAILQCVHNKQEGDVSLNERMLSFRDPSLKSGSQKKECTLQDACFSMMFLEEIDVDGLYPNDYLMIQYIRSGEKLEDFVQKLSDSEKVTFNETYEKISKKIHKRMNYVNKQFKKQDIINAIKGGSGMKELTQIFNDSKIYEKLTQSGEWNENITSNENREHYKDLLFKDLSKEKVENFEKLKEENPSLFVEILGSTTLDGFLRKESNKDNMYKNEEDRIILYHDKNGDKNYEENVKVVVLYKKWLSMTEGLEGKQSFDVPNIYKNKEFIQNILKNDFKLDGDLERKSMPKEDVIDKINIGMFRKDNLDISDDVFQNILYRLATELYGYNGKNDKLEIIHYFSEKDCNINGIYFDSKRKINEDWAIDGKLLTTALKQNVILEKDVDKYVNGFMSQFFKTKENGKGDRLEGNVRVESKETIDTQTESIDPGLNKEFINTLRIIVKEELMNHTVENQGKVKENIYNFVKKYGNGENYIDLPYYLVLDAKKAGLGDMQRQFFRYNNDKVEICYLPSELGQRSAIDDCENFYITPSRKEYTEEEKYYIDRVDSIREKLEKILNNIGVPVELHDIILTEGKKWNTFKKNVLLYNGKKAKNSDIVDKYIEYAEYFENLYRGILISVSGFSRSSDISNIDYFNMAMAYGDQNLFDTEGHLLEVNEKNGNERNELAKQQEFIDFYNKQIETLKIGGKTIKELRTSEDKKEKELAYRASNIIYTTVLEYTLIDDDGTIHPGNDIKEDYHGYGGGGYTIRYKNRRYLHGKGYLGTEIDQDKINNVSKIIENKIKGLKIAPEISEIRINNLRKEQTIKKLSKEEKEATDTTFQIQSIIESTGDGTSWKGKRGGIKYDIEKSVIRSRGKEVKVEEVTENSMKLKGLELDLTLQEGVRLANFKTRLKYTFGDQKIEHTRGLKSSFDNTFYVGKTKIIERAALEKFCPISKDDDAREKIKDWLNQSI